MYAQDFKIYKPNAKNSGGALCIRFDNLGLWLNVAPQAGDRIFDWKNNKIILKLGASDIIKLADIVKNKYQMITENNKRVAPKEAKIYHKNANGYSEVTMVYTSEYNSFYFSVYSSAGSVNKKAGLPITIAEAEALIVMLNYALPKIHQWDQIIVEDRTKKEFAPKAQEELPIIQTEETVPPAINQPTAAPAPAAPTSPAVDPMADFNGLNDTGETINDQGIPLSEIPF